MTTRYDRSSATERSHPKRRLRDRLENYARQAAAFRTSPVRPGLGIPLSAGTLAAIVPLTANVDNAEAQCLSSFTVSASAGNSYLTTFSVGATKALFLSLNPFASGRASALAGVFGATGNDGFQVSGGQVNALPDSAIVGAFGTFGAGRLCDYSFGGTSGVFCPVYGGVRAGFQVGPQTGWLRMQLNTLTDSSASMTVLTGFYNPIPGNETHIPDCGPTLPVELVAFDAIVHQDAVQLTWETASELNNAGFEIQRAKGDGTFRKVAFVDGHGTTSDPQSYAFADADVETNVRYRYRLKQIDLDGATSFSDVVEVFTEDPGAVALSDPYPNPTANGRARMDLNIADAQPAAIEIYDVRGALVGWKTQVLNAGHNELLIDTVDLAPGTHFAKVEVGGRVMYRTLVVR